jgi:hypothetical protein
MRLVEPEFGKLLRVPAIYATEAEAWSCMLRVERNGYSIPGVWLCDVRLEGGWFGVFCRVDELATRWECAYSSWKGGEIDELVIGENVGLIFAWNIGFLQFGNEGK